MTAGAVLRISGNKGRHVWPFWVFRYRPNWAKNNHLTPVWSLIQMYLFLSLPFWFFFSKKIASSQCKKAAYSYEISSISVIWFLQNHGKGCIRTNMHTTVSQFAGFFVQVVTIGIPIRILQDFFKNTSAFCDKKTSSKLFSVCSLILEINIQKD